MKRSNAPPGWSTSTYALTVRRWLLPAFAVSSMLSCADADDDPLPATSSVTEETGATQTTGAPLFYDHSPAYCEDTDPMGAPWAPSRPVWSDLAGPHYDGIVHTNGAQSIRYPDYRNVSHNLAVLESLQFLLSMVTNITNKVEDAQSMLQEGTYVDAAYGLLPQVDGHCVCINGSCDPATVLDNAEQVVEELIDIHNIEAVLQDYIDQKVNATIADLRDLLDYFVDAVQPSGAIVTTVEQAIQQAIDNEIQTAILQMTGVSAPACTSSAFAQPGDYAAAIEPAVTSAVAELEAELQADVQTIEDAINLAVGTPAAVLEQLKADLETVKGFFEGVNTFDELIQLDWPVLVQTLQNMVPFYQNTVQDIQATINDVSGVWQNLTALDDRINDLADQIYSDVMANIAASNPQMADCIAALQNASSFNPGAYDPSAFAGNLTSALEGTIDTLWNDMKDRVQLTWQNIEERITGIGPEDGLAIFNAWTANAQGAINSTVEACYMRGPRPECFEHCAATDENDFIWLPVDFLQDPAALAAGTASGALFALEQTGWLDDFREWVATQMEGELGAAFTSVLGFLADFQATIQKIIEILGDTFEYIDQFSEGYHLGAYSDLRPDLHMCVGYYGHGAYAQMGGLGGDRISIGARYSSHNLSRQSRVQFRSAGFAVSAFGHDLSILPSVELDWQMDGFKLWDQSRPFGIPLNIPINPQNVARYDVFNVVPMDRYPFGFTPGQSIQDQTFPAGAFLVRDLFPSGATFNAIPDWPRPGVTDPWEARSIAVMSLGLNLQFDYPANGPEFIEIATLEIIPAVLTVTPVFGFQLGAQWEHQVDLLRDRVVEKVNQNLPAPLQIDDSDFARDMHAMQGPDLTADNRASVYVEPSLGVEAFLGFTIRKKVQVGVGALMALGINIRPAGAGGILDVNAALGEALTNSNPPTDAPCTPVWDWSETWSCNNDAFPESEGEYSCSPAESVNSCCMQITIRTDNEEVGGPVDGTASYSMCVDDWTGITQEYCEYLDLPNATVDQARSVVASLPGFLANIRTRLLELFELADTVTINGTWRSEASCAEQECGGAGWDQVFSTAFLNVQTLSECEQMGFCTYETEDTVHDVTQEQCESGSTKWIDVDTDYRQTCGVRDNGELVCWGLVATGAIAVAPPAGVFSSVDTTAQHTCAISAVDGEVTCWMWDSAYDNGQADAPAGPFQQVSTTLGMSCGVRNDGALSCWGGWADTVWSTVPTSGIWTKIEAGSRICALNAAEELWCFGGGVSPYRIFAPAAVTDFALSGHDGVCALRPTGDIDCASLGNSVSPGYSCAAPGAFGSVPFGPFVQITGASHCGGCGLRADGSVACWGAAAGTSPLGLSPSQIVGGTYANVFLGPTGSPLAANHLCGIDASGSLACVGSAAINMPSNPPSGTFTPYTCRASTDGEVTGWTGSGCHPLQHGWNSACDCSADTDCAAGETCVDGNCALAGNALSCGCETTGDCSAGRVCTDGACTIPCASATDCPAGLECTSGACMPMHGIPFAESITSAMANVDSPIHLISSFAMSEIYATLKLTVNLYVELGFKLFGKERKWRILDFNRGFDVGSTWKGWYQPGLEARYQDECSSPALLEPVTNRFPRSLTSNPYDTVFNAPGVSLAGFCNNGGVCRYRDPLPASENDPRDYALGNVGTVNDFLEYCYADYPEHQENPDHSTNEQIISSAVDTFEFGREVTLTVWETNQVCVDGVVWDEWIAGLEPTIDAGGTITDPGAFAGYNCLYDDPVTGVVSTFPCADINVEMMSTWGCLDTTANPFAQILASAYPALVINHPVHGSILDIDAMFVTSTVNDPTYGLGELVDYELSNMIATYRNHFQFPAISRVGERWLQQLDVCFSERFDSPAETACECVTNEDCDSEAGQFCQANVCMESIIGESGEPEIVQAFCPIVDLVADVGLCCGDGVIQNTDGYSEECDDGPEGSATCSAQCTLLDTSPAGACCAGDGVCYENLNQETCEGQGGAFYDATTCDDLSYCEEGDPVDPTPLGACCADATCVDALSEVDCLSRRGIWNAGQNCADINYCRQQNPAGACCVGSTCVDANDVVECENLGGAYNPGSNCQQVNICIDTTVTGACCADLGCYSDIDQRGCDELSGTFTEGATCDDINYCGQDERVGACCTPAGICLDALTEMQCLANGGRNWQEGVPASACDCDNDGQSDPIERPNRGCTTTGDDRAPLTSLACLTLALLTLRRRRATAA